MQLHIPAWNSCFWQQSSHMVNNHMAWTEWTTTFSNVFLLIKMFTFLFIFCWNSFIKVQLTIYQHWLRQWLGTCHVKQGTSHYLNQWGPGCVWLYCVTRPQWVNVYNINPWTTGNYNGQNQTVISTVNADALVLIHQDLSVHNAGWLPNVTEHLPIRTDDGLVLQRAMSSTGMWLI